MTYAGPRRIVDADSHVMERADFLVAHADPAVRDRIPRLDGGRTGLDMTSGVHTDADREAGAQRKVTGGFRSDWDADLYTAVRSVVGTAARRGIDAYQAIRTTLQGQSVTAPG
mgnify:CR=1 FL=1